MNILDISLVASCFGVDLSTNPQCEVADVNGDGSVDTKDLEIVTSEFGNSVTIDPDDANVSVFAFPSSVPVLVGKEATIGFALSNDGGSAAEDVQFNIVTTGVASIIAISALPPSDEHIFDINAGTAILGSLGSLSTMFIEVTLVANELPHLEEVSSDPIVFAPAYPVVGIANTSTSEPNTRDNRDIRHSDSIVQLRQDWAY